jgi:antitoxin component YwqK of YwqJK toxin-antitoxin module
MEVQYYKNGLKNGGDTIFYENGMPKFTLFLVDDKKEGFLRKWDEEGNITYEAKFKMDKLVEVNGKQLQ